MRKSKIIRIVLLVGVLSPAASMLSGCPAGTYGSVIEPQQRAAIVRGKTTRDELLRRLGTPDKIVDLGNGRQEFSYIQETIANRANYNAFVTSTKSQFWVILRNNVVEAFGDRSTTEGPNYLKWLNSGG